MVGVTRVSVLLVLLLTGLVSAGLLVAASRTALPRERASVVMWQTAAARLGLELREEARGRPQITGQRRGRPVCIEVAPGGSARLRIRFALAAEVPATVMLGAESFWIRTGLRRAEGLRIGDPAFDARLRLQGDSNWAHATFDADARAACLALDARGDLELADRELTWTSRAAMRDASTLIETVETLETIAMRMGLPRRRRAGMLLRIATKDPAVDARCRALSVLLRDHPLQHETKRAIMRGFESDLAPLRAIAIGAMDRFSLSTLERVAFGKERKVRGATGAVVEVAALSRVVELIRRSKRPRLVRRALRSSRTHLWAVAARAVVEHDLHDEDIEPLLLSCLEQLSPVDRDDDTEEIAVLEAIGHIGSLAVVEALLARSTGLLTRPAVKRAQRDAISAIQHRHGISLGGTLGGALSLSDSAGAGAVTLAEDTGDA